MRRRLLLVGLAAVLLLVVLPVVVIHLPPVQEMVWERVQLAVAENSGLELGAERFRLRMLPAKLELEGISVAAGDERLAFARRLTATWRWRSILGEPRRLETVAVEELEVRWVEDALPEGDEDGEMDLESVLDAFEIGELRIVEYEMAGSAGLVSTTVDGLSVTASLIGGRAEMEAKARQLLVIREDRELDLGAVALRASADAETVNLQLLEASGSGATIRAAGGFDLVRFDGAIEIAASADLARLAGWFDPNIVTGLEPRGSLEIQGKLIYPENGSVEGSLVHSGEEIEIAGYPIEQLEASLVAGQPSIAAGHPEWGRIDATLVGPMAVEVAADFDRAPLDRLLPFVAPRIAVAVRPPVTLSGTLDATVSYPIVIDQLRADADLELQWADGRVAVAGAGSGREWAVSNAAAEFAGAAVSARGRLSGDRVEATARVRAERPDETVRRLAEWMPELEGLAIAGGPLEVDGVVSGSLSSPGIELRGRWSTPQVAGFDLESIAFDGSGNMDQVEWGLDIALDEATALQAEGTARPKQPAVAGSWQLRADDLGAAERLAPELHDAEVGGAVHGRGDFSFENGAVQAAGELDLDDLEVLGWTVPRGAVRFSVDPARLHVEDLKLEVFGGSIEGSAEVGLEGAAGRVRSDLRWRDLRLGELPVDLPEAAAGRVSGFAEIDGSLQDPTGRLETAWIPDADKPLAERVDLVVGLDGGLVRATTGVVQSVVGPLVLTADVPLGSFDRPAWLWPEAPNGPVRAQLLGTALDTSRLSEVVALPEIEVVVSTDLAASVEWDPQRSRPPVAFVEADGMRITHSEGELAASGPVVAAFDGTKLRLEPVVFEGQAGRIAAEATVDTVRRWVDGRLSARVDPSAIRWLPVDLEMDGTLELEADVSGPTAVDGWQNGARGTVRIDHRGGRFTRRDPPLEVRDLWLQASLDRRGLTVDEGSALVNRGLVELGGGWDPASGQGLVAELDGVTLMTAGILTRWGGALAVEPDREKLAKVAGNLTLLAGLWDETLSLGQAFLGAEDDVVAPDDPLHEIGLDLTVRQASRVRVDNNLGRFDASWDVLRVSGTAAEPILEGEVRIESGGVLNLAGQELQVRRGSFEFTGNPDIDPIIEIVQGTDTTLFEWEGGGGELDTQALATQGLTQGINTVLGTQNTSVQPAEIATQIERDPSSQIMIGQQVSRNLAVFFGTNVSDVQDRTTMLQAWGIPGLPRFILQAYQETIIDNFGLVAQQKFLWGGGKDLEGEIPRIQRLRLRGSWPIAKRSLRRSTRLRTDQPFDPFLPFVAAQRMERRLAEVGYQSARVDHEVAGKELAPVLVFECDPGPRQEVRFEGDRLAKEVRGQVTALYRPPPLESVALRNMEEAARLHLVSRGFSDAEVRAEQRDGEIVLTVNEGEATTFRGPVIVGVPPDAAFGAAADLGSPLILSRALRDPAPISRRIERRLAAEGFADARVVEVRSELDGDELVVKVEVEAGERAEVASVRLAGSDPLGLLEDERFSVRAGMPMDRAEIESEVRRLRRRYLEAGYREVRTRAAFDHQPESGWEVTVELRPGPKRTVREVNLAGSRGLSPRVLRRGIEIEPGDVLTDAAMDASASKVANFAPVERVDVRTYDRGSSEIDVEFDITKKRRWSASVGAGFSTERGAQFNFGFRDDNLLARGISVDFRGSWDQVERRIFTIFSMPPAPGSPWNLIATLGYGVGEAPDEPDLLEQEGLLASLEAQYAVTSRLGLAGYYRWTDTRTYEQEPDEFFPFDVRVRLGLVGTRVIFDRYDDLFNPGRGFGLTSDLGVSSETWGSDFAYATWLTTFGFAIPFARQGTWLQTARVGAAEPFEGDDLIREARFFAGGQGSMRGFDRNSVGPVTFGFDGSLVPAGGGALLILNEELRFSIWRSIRAAVFADIGQVWRRWGEIDDELSVGAGLGLRWSTPIGLLWADVAWPVHNPGISSETAKFYIGIGRPF